MIYLHRFSTGADGSQSVDIAVVEDAGQAGRFEIRGYSRCTLGEFRAAWRERDERSLAQLRAIMLPESEVVSGQATNSQTGIYQAMS